MEPSPERESSVSGSEEDVFLQPSDEDTEVKSHQGNARQKLIWRQHPVIIEESMHHIQQDEGGNPCFTAYNDTY